MASGVDKNVAPYYPDGGYGWIIVGAISLINISLLTLVPCFGLIFRDEFAQWHVTSAQTSFLLHLHSSLYCSFGFFTSPLLKKYGIRPVALAGATLMCLGIFLSSFATSYVYLVITVSVLIGVGQGVVMPATYFATYTYFRKRLTVATSLTVTSACLSSIVIPKFCDILLSNIGRTKTILILSVISLLAFVGCFLLKPVEEKKKSEEEQEENCLDNFEKSANKEQESLGTNTTNKYKEIKEIENPTSLWSKLFHLFDLHLLKDVPFILIVIGLGISFASELNIILMLQFMLRDLANMDRSDVATAVSIQSGADLVGRLVIPLVGHYFKAAPEAMYTAALILASLARTVLSVWSADKMAVFTAVAIIGLTKGTRAVFQSVILPKYVPLKHIAAANGLNMFFTGGVSLLIGPLIGVIHDQTNSYRYTLHAASGLSTLCVILWIIDCVFWKKTERTNGSDS